jgi:hypothetical protein
MRSIVYYQEKGKRGTMLKDEDMGRRVNICVIGYSCMGHVFSSSLLTTLTFRLFKSWECGTRG